jgi:uncharacterized membrane protein (UPF0127 family)
MGPVRNTPATVTDFPSRRGARTPRWARLLARVGLAAMVASPAASVLAQDAPQPKLPVVRLQAGMHVIHAEAAISARQRELGLMMRERLGPNEGMLFVFDEKRAYCFWMRNTLLPLSIAFLDDEGRIVNIADMAPRTEDSHCAAQPVRFALEMEQGWFARRAIGPGAQLSNPRVFPGQARN